MDQANPYQSPRGETSTARKPSGFTWIELVVVAAIIATLWALLYPSISTPPGVYRRTQCRNNLKQLALAFHNYHDQYGCFPPAVVVDSQGQAMHSWRILLLPFLEHQELYDRYQFDQPWDSPDNLALQDFMPGVYRCPSFYPDKAADPLLEQQLRRLTNYVVISDPDGIFHHNRIATLRSISDGTSLTLLTTEVHQHAVHWMAPEDVTFQQLLTDLRLSEDEDCCNHVKGLQMGLADGSVHYVSHDLAAETLKALITINGGEQTLPEF
ncbi:MAG: DUF1559 domain-containing protein [Planctomycetaceae bacterium]